MKDLTHEDKRVGGRGGEVEVKLGPVPKEIKKHFLYLFFRSLSLSLSFSLSLSLSLSLVLSLSLSLSLRDAMSINHNSV